MVAKSNKAAKTAAKQAEKPADAAPKSKKVLGADDFSIPSDKAIKADLEKDLRKIAKETGAPRASQLEAAKREAAGLAKGVDGRNSPHSAKALGDERAKAKGSNKADKKVEKEKAKADRKAARAAKASPKADDTRKITILKKDFAFGREGSARRMSWDACLKSKTVADYAKAGGKLKYLPRWSTAGAIKLG